MGFLNFKRNTEQDNKESNTENTNKYQSYSSPLVKIGKGDLTKPYINSTSLSNSQYVLFGRDNKYPQLIDQMYYQSPLHSSIIDFQINAAIGGGFEIIQNSKVKGTTRVEQLTFLKQIKAPKLLRGIALDIKMHKRTHLKITKKHNKIVKVQRVSPAKVRYNKEMDKFWISDDWFSFSKVEIFEEYDYIPSEETQVQIYSFIDIESCPGQDVYPLDRTISLFNWCYLDGQSANLQKDNIQRSIFGNLVIKRPNEFKSTEEFDIFKRGIETKEGEVVPVLLLSADGKENLPEVENFPANENDKAFANMDKRIDDKICQAHTINPIVMGIERPGALGSGSDIKEAYPIWEKNVVKPYRLQLEEIMDDVMFLFNIKGSFKLNEYKIVDSNIEDKEEEDKFDDDTNVNSNTNVNSKLETSKVEINDNLKGLNASENSDIYRIVRDFNKGRLNKAIASTRLLAYGITEGTIEEILKPENK